MTFRQPLPVLGAFLGALLAGLLLLNGVLYGEKALAGSAMLAWVLGVPVSFGFAVADFGTQANERMAFIALVLPLNGALCGLVVGAGIRLLRRLRRRPHER
jgi:hypothetical protein